MGKPALQERSGGGKNEEWQTRGEEGYENNVADRMLGVRRAPCRARRDGGGPRGGKNKDKKCGRGEKAKMESCLRGRGQAFGKEVRIEIASEEQQLEDEHVGGPDSGGATEPGKNVFADNELHLKEEERAEENGGSERPDNAFSRRVGRRFVGLGRGIDCGGHARSVAGVQRRAKFMRHR